MRLMLDPSYDFPGLDVLIRGYENQDSSHPVKEQCAGDICFSEKCNIEFVLKDNRALAEFPRGISRFIAEFVKDNMHKDVLVGVCNEFPNRVGALTSCNECFRNSLEVEFEKVGLDLNKLLGNKR